MVVHPFRDIARFRRASFEYDGEADRQHQQYGDDRGLKSQCQHRQPARHRPPEYRLTFRYGMYVPLVHSIIPSCPENARTAHHRPLIAILQ